MEDAARLWLLPVQPSLAWPYPQDGLNQAATRRSVPIVAAHHVDRRSGAAPAKRSSTMTKTAMLLTLIAAGLACMPAHAQQRLRVFVSSQGSDANPCTVTQPCLSFQQAYNNALPNGVINVLDVGGYGPLTITHGISIQGHGFAGIVQNAGNGITIAVTTGDPVSLDGLLIDGAGAGNIGILISSGPSVQILNSVVRHFVSGIAYVTSTNGANLLIEDTIASDNSQTGIILSPSAGVTVAFATLNRITANNNRAAGVAAGGVNATIANSVISNNSNTGLDFSGGFTWLAKNVISGNSIGVSVGGTVNSYGDNYIRNNGTPVGGTLTPVTTQ